MQKTLNTKIYLTTFLFFVISAQLLRAQIYLENTAIYNEAEEYLAGEEYEEALPLLLMLENKGLLNPNISYKIGLCYLNLPDEAGKSVPYLEMAANNTTLDYKGGFDEITAPIQAVLLLGRALQITGNIKRAEIAYENYKNLTKVPGEIQLTDFYIKQCRLAALFMANPTKVDFDVIADQSNFNLYNPVVSSGNAFFMERRKFYDAFVSANIMNDSLLSIQNRTSEIGSDGNLVVAGSNHDGTIILFVGYEAGFGYELYYAEPKNDGKWGRIVKFPPPVNSQFNETSGCLTSDGKLIFSSNRPGGQGGQDLYSTQRNNDGQWAAPVNLGTNINTPFNEASPFYSKANNALYFSSQGHQNIGGYDFFCAVSDKKEAWLPAINMGYPVSTTGDDLFLYPTSNSNLFYSDRIPFGSRQRSKLVKLTIEPPVPVKKVLVSGELEFTDKIPPKEVDYTIVENASRDQIIESKTTKEGEYEFLLPAGSYTFTLNHSTNISATRPISIESTSLIDELTLESPEWIVLTREDYNKRPLLVLSNILFEFNSYQLSTKSKPMLDSLASIVISDKSVNILITGYTDAIGSESYNLILSRKRADAVVKYLTAKGVPANQLLLFALGKSNPVALNATSDGTDLPEGRKYNRRVEIEIRGAANIEVKRMDSIPENLRIK